MHALEEAPLGQPAVVAAVQPHVVTHAVQRLADSIREANPAKPVCLVGIRSRGDEVAERICTILAEQDVELSLGVLDISLYRDDFEHLRWFPYPDEAVST